jgi:hypothetical protein
MLPAYDQQHIQWRPFSNVAQQLIHATNVSNILHEQPFPFDVEQASSTSYQKKDICVTIHADVTGPMLFFMWDSDSNVAMATACNLW